MNISTIELDICKAGTNSACVNVAQGDMRGATVKAYIYDNGTETDLSGCDVYMVVKLPDRRHYYRGTCSVDGSTATHVCDESKLCAVPGYTDEAYFEIVKDGSRYSTERFAVDIARSAVDGQKPAENWDNEVTDMIDRGNAAIVAVGEALEDATEGYAAAEASRNQQYDEAEESRNQQFNSAESDRNAAQAANDAAQAKNNADQALNNQMSQGLLIQILSAGEYDAGTGEPTIDGAVGKLYFVPTGEDEEDAYVEWMWIDSNWERVGMSNATIETIATDQIDAAVSDGSPQGKQVLNLTGLSYLWAKIKAWAQGAFAALTHKHDASDIASGALPVERGGTGSTTAEAARAALGAASQTEVDEMGEYISQTDILVPSNYVRVVYAVGARVGRVASVSFQLEVVQSVSNNVTLGTVRDGFKPYNTQSLSSFGKTTYLPYVDEYGNVKCNIDGTISSGNLYFAGTYILDE